ncbi:hypothetical protein DIURU_003698 [Diutina rugosa]|uniref:6-phosphofructo-2-kinase domain-containing protein n=1 Tax=Diutina rugosa TaxID=5481 RepID=A0A642US07_DIURU|nr:uncharacterized protein DIURU_003698 [Diutina rugosa]KAA8900716.1 hypothetical protein DIURU_003698 [Diutina rugosa]
MTKAEGNVEALLNAANATTADEASHPAQPPQQRPLRSNLSEALHERYRYFNTKSPDGQFRRQGSSKQSTPEPVPHRLPTSLHMTRTEPPVNAPPGAMAARKKVSFSNLHSACSSASISSRESSPCESDDDDEPSSPNQHHPHHNNNGQPQLQLHHTISYPTPRLRTSSVSNSPSPTPTMMMNADKRQPLRKLMSYQGADLGVSKSLDSTLSSGHGSQVSLPEFNKRPLTDTPIVSSLASPITRHASDIEEVYEEEDANAEFRRTKNISHLNLSDMGGSGSVSPLTRPPESQTPPKITLEPSMEAQALPQAGEPVPKRIVPVPVEGPKHTLPPSNLEPQTIERITNLLLDSTERQRKKKQSYTLNIPGQTSSKTSPDGHIAKVDVGSKLVIVMVGLPARGKSYITNKLTRYLNWLQHDCRVFNVGNTRRKNKPAAGPESTPLPDNNSMPGSQHQSPETLAQSPPTDNHDHNGNNNNGIKQQGTAHNAAFFDPKNKASIQIREKWAMDTLDQLLDYVLEGQGSVGIFDATNSTKLRRSRVLRRIQQRSNGELKVLFLESICSDPAILEANIRLKLSGPDYKDMDPEVALKDFEGRLQNYEKAYETIDEDEEESLKGMQYVKMINVGKKVVAYNVQGFLASQTVYFLLNFNLCERQIWITRHGEATDNVEGKIGGDSHLTKRGRKFARCLAQFMDFQRREFRKQQLERFSSRLELRYNYVFNPKELEKLAQHVPSEPNFCVWTSMLMRSIETAQYFDDTKFSIKEMRMLNELGGGKFEGMTYGEIQEKFPKEFDARLKNKLSYRYPGVGGESYLDVLTRLRPLITEIERTTDHLLIISHRVVLRILLAYFLNLEKSSIGSLDVPLHTLYCLESKPYGTDYRMYEYDENIDWFVSVKPEHSKNVKEVGVQFRERKYSVVPTAPPTRSSCHRASNAPPPLRPSMSMNDSSRAEKTN